MGLKSRTLENTFPTLLQSQRPRFYQRQSVSFEYLSPRHAERCDHHASYTCAWCSVSLRWLS
jgi:hypothetical protein